MYKNRVALDTVFAIGCLLCSRILLLEENEALHAVPLLQVRIDVHQPCGDFVGTQSGLNSVAVARPKLQRVAAAHSINLDPGRKELAQKGVVLVRHRSDAECVGLVLARCVGVHLATRKCSEVCFTEIWKTGLDL